MSTAVDAEPKRPIPLWRRALLGLAVLAAVVVALLVTAYVSKGARGSRSLLDLVAELDATDPGWRLDELESRREVVPEIDNSARVLRAARSLLPRQFPSRELAEVNEEVPLPERLPAKRRTLLDKEMPALEPALVEARQLADMPQGRLPLVIPENPMRALLEPQQQTRNVAFLLALDARYLAERGDAGAALRSCRAMLDTARALGDEPLLLSQLIRTSNAQSACDALERTLSLVPGDAAELAKLADLLALEEKHPGLDLTWRAERAGMHAIFTGLIDGRFSIKDVVWDHDNTTLVLHERLAGWHLAGEAQAEHLQMLRLYTRAVAIAKLPAHEQIAPEAVLHGEVRSLEPRTTVLRHLFNDVKGHGERHRRGQAKLRLARVLVALEQHRLAKGSWPATLEELGLKVVDPFDGKPLRYVRHAEGVTVYSIGPDGKDDGGKIDRERPRLPGTDLGYQLWDVGKRAKASSK